MTGTNTRGRLLTGAIWIVAAKSVRNVVAIVSILVLANLLTPADFGLVALGTTFISILWGVMDIPIADALIQHRSPTPDHFNTAFTITMLRAVAMAAIMLAAAWPMAVFYKDPRVINVMVVIAVSILLGGLGNPRAIMLTKNLIFWQQFMLQAANSLTSLLVSIGLALIHPSYWALLAGMIASPIVSNVLSYTVLPFRPRFTLARSKELLSFSVWLSLGAFIGTLNGRLDQLLVGGFLGKTMLGYYILGDNLSIVPTREAIAPLSDTLFPALSNLAHDKARLRDAYVAAQSLVTAIALPMGVGFALVADPLLRLVLGQKWLPVIFITESLAAVVALGTLGGLAQALALATGQTRLLFRRDLQFFIFRVPIILFGMYEAGLPGIIYARIFTGLAGIFFNTSIVTRLTGLSLAAQFRQNGRALVAVTLMAAGVAATGHLFDETMNYAVNVEKLFAEIAVGAVLYVGVSSLLWHWSGRPAGPETEILAVLKKFRHGRAGLQINSPDIPGYSEPASLVDRIAGRWANRRRMPGPPE